MTLPSSRDARTGPRWLRGLCCLLLGLLMTAFGLQAALEDFDLGGQFLSRPAYEWFVGGLGGRIEQTGENSLGASIDFIAVAFPLALVGAVGWFAGAWLISRGRRQPFNVSLADWACYGWLWWIVPGLWELMRLATFAAGWTTAPAFLTAATGLCDSICLAGWLATFFTLRRPCADQAASATTRRFAVPAVVWLAMICYVAAFTTMNWQLYRGLLVPHGDSAMYEEHLWNLEHGKGFRSYLDRGLFLGEHIQVIHILLVPLHLVWPSLMGMELCQSLALASGAIPVFWMAQRHTGSKKAAALLAIAYLLYFPMHFLDISIDLKTFRPGSFGTPVLLFAIDQLERRRYITFSALLVLAFSAQEDFAIVCAPLGVWLALRPATKKTVHDNRFVATPRSRAFGLALAIFATAYFFAVVMIILPWFRGGVEIHYVGYLSKYGKTAGEVVTNMLMQPGLWLPDLLSARTLLYTLFVVAPLGFIPLLSPGRLSVGLPLFFLLCLNELTKEDVYPRHHFHAPLVPIVFWAAAAGLGNVPRFWNALWRMGRREKSTTDSDSVLTWASDFVWTSALATSMLISLGPLGRNFWDFGSDYYWRTLYIPGKRAEMFTRIDGTIPQSSRVASTDFVHPRFTHYKRSYDYSEYKRAVNDNKPGAPPDTDYIVIDTRHRYSTITRPEQIAEFRDHPGDWEVLPDETEGYFIVLKRKAGRAGAMPSARP